MFHRLILAVPFLVLSLIGFASAQGPFGQGNADAPELGGVWLAVGGTHHGRELTKEELAQIKLHVGNGAAIEINPLIPPGQATPNWSYFCTIKPEFKQISFTRNVGIKGTRYPGICEFANDGKLRVCLNLSNWEMVPGLREQPRAFPDGKENVPFTVLTFRKQTDQDRLEGTWQGIDGSWSGLALTREQAQGCKLSIANPKPDQPPLGGGNHGLNLSVPDRLIGFKYVQDDGTTKTHYVTSWSNYSFALDPAKTPRTIHASKIIGIKGVGFAGIYAWEGEKLKICFNFDPSRKPPQEFKSPRGSETLLLTMQRVK